LPSVLTAAFHPAMAADAGPLALAVPPAAPAAAAAAVSWLDELGPETQDHRSLVYLITFSRLLPATVDAGDFREIQGLARTDILAVVRDAWENPLPADARGGRPRSRQGAIVTKAVVFQEVHADGAVHFHAAVLLADVMRWHAAKRVLTERHHLASHFSSSHTQWWSAVRYGCFPTEKKTSVDAEPLQWAADGVAFNLFEDSQQPWCAQAWRGRREKRDREAAATGKAPRFTKLDFIALVLSKDLSTKDAVLRYVQEHGTVVMQAFVAKHQGQLSELLADAKDWESAPANAALEQETDWSLLCRAAGTACPHGGEASCSYHLAVTEIFGRNMATLSQSELATALRAILVGGPSKLTRVPFLVGPSNSGKSTLLYPFDDLFTAKRVLHKPALGSTFGLRNITKKRFIFWDDYRPVEFAQEKTVTVSLFLNLFIGKHSEIQVSQAFNDGNMDVEWKRGAVFTAKEEGLWTPTGRVSAEDVTHMRNRVQEFRFSSIFEQGTLKDVKTCCSCMGRWIRDGAAARDAAGALRPLLPLALPHAALPAVVGDGEVRGFRALAAAAQVPQGAEQALLRDLLALGAVCVEELEPADWQGLPAWAALRPLEQRRLMQHAARALL